MATATPSPATPINGTPSRNTPISEKAYREVMDGQIFFNLCKKLGIAKILASCGFNKQSRRHGANDNAILRTPIALLSALLSVVFHGPNLFRFLGSKEGKQCQVDDNTFYRFLQNPHYNWRRFLLLLSGKIAEIFTRNQMANRTECFVLDDTIIKRGHSKKVELLSFIFDHTIGKSVRGFSLVTLGWTNGKYFLPINFIPVATKKIIQGVLKPQDKRTVGGKNRQMAVMTKPNAALQMVREALNAGFKCSYMLMDSWYATDPMISGLRAEGVHTIGMLKDKRQKYWCGKRLYTLDQLFYTVNFKSGSDYFGSIYVRNKTGQIPLRLVFVRNRNKKSEYLVILCTDLTLSDEEIIRLYSQRWNIEVCFKSCKSLLNLGKEYQNRNFDVTVSSFALVFIRFALLEYVRGESSEPSTFPLIFYRSVETARSEREEMWKKALEELLDIFVEVANGKLDETAIFIRQKVIAWYVSQPYFIKEHFPDFYEKLGCEPNPLPEAV